MRTEATTDQLYFAYGSNLHPLRLRERVGEVTLVSIGEMRRARLRFNKIGRDGSGKCNVGAAGELGETVPGAIYSLSPDQVLALDGFESLGRGYQRHLAEVQVPSAGVRHCFTYGAMQGFVDERLAPFSWYKALVALGARYHGFSREYLANLELQPSIADPDELRAEDERKRADRMRGFPLS